MIRKEIGDLRGVATDSFNMALLYQQEGEPERALALAQEAAAAFGKIGHAPNAQRAQQLVTQLQGGEAPAPAGDPAQAAFEAFQRAASPQEMQAAVSQYPLLTEDGFIQAIEETIAERVPTEHQAAFQERLDWLRQLTEEQE